MKPRRAGSQSSRGSRGRSIRTRPSGHRAPVGPPSPPQSRSIPRQPPARSRSAPSRVAGHAVLSQPRAAGATAVRRPGCRSSPAPSTSRVAWRVEAGPSTIRPSSARRADMTNTRSAIRRTGHERWKVESRGRVKSRLESRSIARIKNWTIAVPASVQGSQAHPPRPTSRRSVVGNRGSAAPGGTARRCFLRRGGHRAPASPAPVSPTRLSAA